MNWDDWPKCAVPACQNKCCLRLRSKYCWPHTPGTPSAALENLRETEPAERLISSGSAEPSQATADSERG